MLGRSYVIETALATLRRENEERAYKFYMADVLRASVEMWGGKITMRYADLINPKPQEERSAEEIIDSFVERLGIEAPDEVETGKG